MSEHIKTYENTNIDWLLQISLMRARHLDKINLEEFPVSLVSFFIFSNTKSNKVWWWWFFFFLYFLFDFQLIKQIFNSIIYLVCSHNLRY